MISRVASEVGLEVIRVEAISKKLPSSAEDQGRSKAKGRTSVAACRGETAICPSSNTPGSGK